MQKKAYSYIRFSTPQQLKGDSLRRQLEASRTYAEKHDLILDDSLRDIGMSAYKGKNATEGALKDFIKLVEDGHVDKGSILILESLDRLSRQQVFTALGLFSSLLSAGVEIVTLADGQHYTSESINDVGQLMFSLISMSRSHEESAVKSKRISASWENKRKLAVEFKRPMTNQCPKWLRISKDRSCFKVIEARAKVIRCIFDQSIAGTGQRKIAAGLNERGVSTFNGGDMWHSSYIAKIIRSKSVIGEYQPKQKGEPIGESIPGYYPAIVSEGIFDKAQAARVSRINPSSAGRKGEKFSNLFSGMCKCLECHSTFRMIKNGRSHLFRCNSNYMGNGCKCVKRWRHRDVENAALLVISEKIDWFSALGGHTSSKQKLESEVAILNAKLLDVEKQVSRFADLFSLAEGSMMTDARKRYVKAMQSADGVRHDIEVKEAELRTFTPVQHNLDRLNRIIFELRSETDVHKLYELRAQINGMFRDVGLKLYFNEHGVFYYLKKTNQKGIVLIDEHKEVLSMGADLEMLQRSFSGMNECIEEVRNLA
ncbi:recombinase family protein [Mariprofundus ferrooxydans]|uniref:recombinase family protein n=1 Tax=Mariprofundus ferrooxydans TaxID=314344 RepID=UPI00035CA727|nr:recombinase family protein [Mariprofundus ferrooxydans]KON47575.1 serine recombinase [Mariprofundus ferrooxydans]